MHNALMGGVVVAPQILDFSAEKSPSSFSHVPIFLTRAFPRDTMSLRKCSAQAHRSP